MKPQPREPLFSRCLPLLAVFCAFTGCHRPADSNASATIAVSTSTPPLIPNRSAEYGVRLAAALAIQNPQKRDETLQAVALSAAKDAEPATVSQAVGAIMNPVLRDNTIETGSLALSKADKLMEATVLAKQIMNPIVRDATLSRLAKQ